MKYNQLFIIGLLATTTLFSCKNDVKEDVKEEVAETAIEVPKKEEVKARDLTPVQKNKVTSLWAKVSARPDTKSFIRLMTSAEIAEMLLIASSEYTIFAPNNASFSVFSEKMNITNDPAQKGELATLLKNHIVAGSINSADLVQTIKKNGTAVLPTLTGQKLTATMDGDAIIITNEAGAKATVKKSDIMASNGVLHVIDAVLQ